MSFFAQPGWKKGEFNGDTYHYLHIKPASPNKPTFILFHGFPIGVLTFRQIVPRLVSEGYGIILPEMPGYGESDRPKDVAGYSRIRIADAAAKILAAENVRKAVVLGHDWGCPVASRFALKYSELTISLILVGITFSPPTGTPFDTQKFNKMFKPILGFEPVAYMDWFVTDEAPGIITKHLESFVHLLLNDDFGHLFCDRDVLKANLQKDLKPSLPAWVQQRDYEELVEFLRRNDWESLLKWYHFALHSADEGDKELPRRMTKPFLYLECQNDPTVPAEMVKTQAQHCDNLTTRSFSAGHWLLEQDSEGSVKAILDWLPSAARL